MKKYTNLFFIVFIFFCHSVFSTQLDDIQDSLDELEFQQYQRNLNESSRQIFTQPNSNNKNKSNKYDYIKERKFNLIYENNDFKSYVQDTSISKSNNSEIYFSFLVNFSKPQFFNTKTFFSFEGNGKIDCQKKLIKVSLLVGMDRQYIDVVNLGTPTWNTKNVNTQHFQNYLCS